MSKKQKKETQGYYLAIGVALGLIYGIIFDKLALGIIIGTAIGLGFDLLVKQDKKKK